MRGPALLTLVLVACGGAHGPTAHEPAARAPAVAAPADEPAADARHPRLWLRAADLPRLRRWARSSNPIFDAGLAQLGPQALEEMRTLTAPAAGCVDHGGTTCESYAELFAFLSLVSPERKDRERYAREARRILMSMMREIARGPDARSPLRQPAFSVDDRSRYSGEAFALTVDWIYPWLDADDKRLVRDVFLRWSDELAHAGVTTDNHPEPLGVVNDPALTRDRMALRWAGNNYFTAHARNLGLMALALDPEDDPDGKLRDRLREVTGAWLYMIRALLDGDARGGLPPEGFEYGPQTLGYVAQLLLALETAGELDERKHGPGVGLADDRFWDDFLVAYPSLLSPATVTFDYRGPIYEPAWYGEGQHFVAPDPVDVAAPLGLLAARRGQPARLAGARLLARELAPGGADELPRRARDTELFRRGILYFLLFDPDAPAPRDARPSLPLTWVAEGLGRLSARTSWRRDASWLTFSCGWSSIDHQTGDCNDFSFYRKGEWLTKRRVGYGIEIGTSEYMNTLALENHRPRHDAEGEYRWVAWRRGAQWTVGSAAGDGKLLAWSRGAGWLYALGDATALYNAPDEGADEVKHASRSLVWLEPDHVVVYDRAESAPGRFKRFWLQLGARPELRGEVAVARTPRGQQLAITRLLPAGGRFSVDDGDRAGAEQAAEHEPMRARLRDEAPAGPREARWLHVLQGADAGARLDAPRLLTAPGWDGVLVRGVAIWFPARLGVTPSLAYTVPGATRLHVVTGLAASAPARLTTTRAADTVAVTVTPLVSSPATSAPASAGDCRADHAGVLAF